MGQTYNVRVVKAEEFLRTCVRTWLEEQGTISPDGNPLRLSTHLRTCIHNK